MSSRKASHHHKKKKKSAHKKSYEAESPPGAGKTTGKKLEIVLKCDTSGCTQTVIPSLESLSLPEIGVEIISSGVGAINKSDIFMAETGSRLIIGFNVEVMPHVDQLASEHGVEIRLYEVIYKLLEDVGSICKSLIPKKSTEKIIGSAKVIALFKSSRKGIILGCEVRSGRLSLGKQFRIIDAMGPIYTGTIESLHIEKDVVNEAHTGQQVGLKINDFNKVRIGDLVESFQAETGPEAHPWQPRGKVIHP